MLNVYDSNNRAEKYVKQKLRELQGAIDIFTVITGDLNIPVSTINRTTRQKISKGPSMVAHAYNPKILGGQGKRPARATQGDPASIINK